MKQRYLAFSVLLFCLLKTGSIHAQTVYPFPQPGFVQTEVYFQDWTQMGVPINYSFVHLADTTAGPYTFSKFSFQYGYGPLNVYTYYDSGKVYWHYANPQWNNPTGGVLIYDFTLVAGDTFQFPFGFSEHYYGPYVVDSVGTMTMLNSQTRKYMRLTNGTNVMHWVDGIGDIERGLTYMTDFEGGHEVLVCSKDSTGDVYAAPNSPFYCNSSDPVPNSGPNTCDQFSFNAQIYGTSCWGCDGYIQLSNVTGGTPGYTYLWSTGATTPFASNLCQGPVTVTIYDAAGDSCSRTFVMYEGQFTMNVIHDSIACDGVDTVCIIPSGGVAPYTWQWSTGNTTMCFPIVVNGTYSVTVTDANGCTYTVVIPANNVQPLSVASTLTAPTCSTCCDGNIALNISGGTAPYSVTAPGWPSTGNFCSGWYGYCVTDSLDCQHCDSVYLAGPLNVPETINTFSIYPNPGDDRIFIQRTAAIPQTATITDVNGNVVARPLLADSTTELNLEQWAAGVYFVEIDGYRQKLVVLHNQ